MKLKHFSVVFIVFWMSSCRSGVQKKQNRAVTKDTLNYAYKIIKKRALDCGNKPDSDCTVVNIEYPVFNRQKVLNDSIENQFLTMFLLRDTATKTLQQMAESFIASYENDKKRDAHIEQYTLNLESSVRSIRDSSLTTLEISGYAFQGGSTWGISRPFY